ncbi:TIGR01777 family oxidoreductase [Branchiibius sp. NY16-3462-2]|uniref:TIGR01777 family oxidoreductase n=1 Tax=Branchiibius sp. NY16-3462-2 TaxID=1807500 RepID=UPI00079A2910|nr:TIGR01777 family oxidoreductase [Branchiibius sp. NY16-3462-2]KYH44002.1 epimerase [Branchiibius sp. NY16-3462-2]
MTQRVAVTGSSGLIGSALSHALTERGDEVIRLVRRPAGKPDEVTWDPGAGQVDSSALQGVSAVVNLAGAGIGDKRWTPEYKQVIRSSRVDSTATIATAVAALEGPVRLLSGSASGFYGDRGEQQLTERSDSGEGFLAGVVRDWEHAAEPAVQAGAPTAYLRTGIVLAPEGGAASRMLPLAKWGLGGPLGSGRQWFPWIALPDHVAAMLFLLDNPQITGPVNLVGPTPARQKELAKALGSAYHRPAVLPAPSFALHAVLGDFASDVLASTKIVPEVLQDNGFQWQFDSLDTVAEWLARST